MTTRIKAAQPDTGDRVTDRNATSDDPDTLLVVDPDIGRAANVEINDDGMTVHDVNDCRATDHVAQVVYEEWLERVYPDYDDTTTPRDIKYYCSEWDIPLEQNLYAFPIPRLNTETRPDER